MKHISTLALAGTLALGSIATAHDDILIARDANNQLVVGSFEFDTNTGAIGQRVFEGEFDDAFVTADPGFNSVAQAAVPSGFLALPGSTAVNFTMNAFTIAGQTSNLFFWDGVDHDNVAFAPVSAGYSLEMTRTGFSAVANGSASNVAGFNIQTTNANGSMHRHLEFILSAPAADSTPADGFYMIGLTFDVVGTTPSDPIWIIFGAGDHDEDAHHEAVEWVEANLVPEPASLSLLGLGAMLLVRRRRNA